MGKHDDGLQADHRPGPAALSAILRQPPGRERTTRYLDLPLFPGPCRKAFLGWALSARLTHGAEADDGCFRHNPGRQYHRYWQPGKQRAVLAIRGIPAGVGYRTRQRSD